jgi:hypothetical protein
MRHWHVAKCAVRQVRIQRLISGAISIAALRRVVGIRCNLRCAAQMLEQVLGFRRSRAFAQEVIRDAQGACLSMRNSYPLGIMSLSPTMRASRCWRASNVRKLLNSSSSALAMCKISSVRQPILDVCSRLS